MSDNCLSDDAENARLSEVNERVDAPDALTVCSLRAEVEQLEQENVRLRDQLDAKEHDAKRNMREYMRVCEENDGLRELCLSMFEEHQRIYDASLLTRTGASSTQMAHWYDELRELGIEVRP